MSTLFIVATPIGNFQDITLRALDILKQADLIAAEDTRRAKRLFADLNLEIKVPVISLFEENEIEKIPDIIEKLKNGLKVVVISDAGTPAISRPGGASAGSYGRRTSGRRRAYRR